MKLRIILMLSFVFLLSMGLEAVIFVMKKDISDPLMLGRAARYLSVYQNQKIFAYESSESKYRLRFGEPVFILGNSADGVTADITDVLDLRDVNSVNVIVFVSDGSNFSGEVYTSLSSIGGLRTVSVTSLQRNCVTDISRVRSEAGIYWERILNKSRENEFFKELWNAKGATVRDHFKKDMNSADSIEVLADKILNSDQFKNFMISVFDNKSIEEFCVNEKKEYEFVEIKKRM